MEGTVKLPGVGPVKKKTAMILGIGAPVLVLAIYWYRARKASQTAAAPAAAAGTGTVTDPAGNTCATLNPTTGYCPGTAEDQSALASMSGMNAPYNTSALGGGLSGYYYGQGTPGA